MSPERPSVTTPRHPIALFFDGECVFCNRWVRRLMVADLTRRTRFGAKQGATFRRIAAMHPEVADIASIVLFRRDRNGGEEALIRSAAVLAAIDGLPGYRLAAKALHFTPRFLADLGYAIFSRFRKMLFGRQDLCDVVRPADRELFLD